MATTTTVPSTPAIRSAVATPDTGSPGTWRHPRLDEIQRRQHASALTPFNMQRVLWNAVVLTATFVVPSLWLFVTKIGIPESHAKFYTLNSIRLLLAYNIAHALLPLTRRPDPLSDIPLTPSQRSLLGLPPSTEPETPAGNYITPPRYARSTTPRSSAGRSSTRGIAGSSPAHGQSPLGAKGTSSGGRQSLGGGSPYSSSVAASPLLQKAVGSGARRWSLDQSQIQSPLGKPITGQLPSGSVFDSSMSGTPPSPTLEGMRGKAGVPLNSKWLYERKWGSPGGRGVMY